MTYNPLNPDPHTPNPVINFLRDHVQMQLHDVHVMLRLPMPEHELDAGCNFTAVNMLLALISGVSTVLYNGTGRSGKRFRDATEMYYPWSEEFREPAILGNPVTPKDGARLLYDIFRNPLAHALGVIHRSDRNKLKYNGTAINRILIHKASLTEEMIEDIERSPTRPLTVPPTLIVLLPDTDGNNTVQVTVAGLYWGVRRMIENLTAQPALMAHAEQYLSS